MRPAAIFVHRWVGLVMATFLIIASVTGSVMAFYVQLDTLLNPELFLAQPPTPNAPLLDPIELRDRVRAQFPKETFDGVILQLQPGHTVNYWIDGRETFIDPYTGKAVGSRKFGDPFGGKQSVLTFIYTLHFTLALDDVGIWIMGLVALLWTVDCFVGAYITLPPASVRRDGKTKPWLERWLPAWMLKTNTLFTSVFTWHRASGLWLWALLLVFAWSGVALNLGEQIYSPVMNAFTTEAKHFEPLELPTPRTRPKLDLHAALTHARSLMQSKARDTGFEIFGERWLDYDAEHGTYGYTVESTLDIDERLAETAIMFDGDSGKLLSFSSPTTEGARTTFDSWIIALHFGAWREGGIMYRSFVCFFGVLVTALTVTGIWIWWRKRKPRRRS